jgi:rSAM-associated Gly-rich repeat protein
MTVRRLTMKGLAMLLPVGVLGISSALAATPSKSSLTDLKINDHVTSVAARLGEIRAGVSRLDLKETNAADFSAAAVTAEWPNFHFGWGNGGWRNGGWRNGGWGNGGWHNWGNGGWHNGGWHNWHNFWHNW